MGARDRPARHDRAGDRGRLARRAHRHRPRQPAAAARCAGDRGDAAAGPHRDPPPQDRSRQRSAAGPGRRRQRPGRRGARHRPGPRPPGHRRPAPHRPAAPPGARSGHPPAAWQACPACQAPGAAGRRDPRPRGASRGGARPRPTPSWPPRSRAAAQARRARSGKPRSATPSPPPPPRPGGAGRWTRQAAAAQARARLRGLAHGLASATALYAGRNWLARRRLRHPAAAIGARRFRRGDLLSVPELAAIARLPADPSLPGLARAGARAVAPPPAIPLPGPDVRPLGVTDTGAPRPVGLAVADARHHLRVIGPTGTGKTTLIAGQILADADAGRGVVFIDPKGDAVTDLLARLPEHVAGKVVLFDPGDRAAPPCLNVLQGDGSGTDTDVIIDNVTGIFRRIFASSGDPAPTTSSAPRA